MCLDMCVTLLLVDDHRWDVTVEIRNLSCFSV